jgi:hypothetical protein
MNSKHGGELHARSAKAPTISVHRDGGEGALERNKHDTPE